METFAWAGWILVLCLLGILCAALGFLAGRREANAQVLDSEAMLVDMMEQKTEQLNLVLDLVRDIEKSLTEERRNLAAQRVLLTEIARSRSTSAAATPPGSTVGIPHQERPFMPVPPLVPGSLWGSGSPMEDTYSPATTPAASCLAPTSTSGVIAGASGAGTGNPKRPFAVPASGLQEE